MKKPFKFWYFQDWGTYDNETIVVVGMSRDEMLKEFTEYESEKGKVKQVFLDAVKELDNHPFTVPAFVSHKDGMTLLWFKEWSHILEDFFTLVHETNHLIVFILMRNKGMTDEMEALAYQQEYLVREISKRLTKEFKVFKSKKTEVNNDHRPSSTAGL